MRLHSQPKGGHSLKARFLLDTKDRLFQIWIISCFVLFLVAGLSGITSSSFSIVQAQTTADSLRNDPLISEARVIRSDEFMKLSPWRIGVLKSGNANFQSPLADSANALTFPDPDSWINTLSAVDLLWPRMVPGLNISQEFAFAWWTPIFLVLIFLPLFLREIGASSLISIATTVTIISSPVSAWWSFLLCPIIGFTSLACYTFIKGSKLLATRKWLAIPAFLIVAFSVFKLLTFYQPWVIVVATITLIPTFVYSLGLTGFRNSFMSFTYSGIMFLVLAGSFIRSNLSGIQAILGTSYPGQRRASGAYVAEAFTWGAPHLQLLSRQPDLFGTNPSELSSSLTLLTFSAFAIFLALLWKRKQLRFQTTAFLILGFWLTWVTLPWPLWSSKVLPISLVPPNRAAAVLGVLAAFTFAYVCQKSTTTDTRLTKSNLALSLTAASMAFLVTFIGGRQMQEIMPRLGNIRIAVACISVAVIAFLLVLEKTRNFGVISVALFSLVLTISVNPIQRNLDGFATGAVPTKLSELASSGGLWASDDTIFDALLMANAIPSLSGQQLTGPNIENWNVLDPTSVYKESWNRGVSSITFDWQQEESVVINATNLDVVTVTTNPCLLAKKIPELTHIASKNELTFTCLSEVSQFYQFGKIKHVYVITQG